MSTLTRTRLVARDDERADFDPPSARLARTRTLDFLAALPKA